MAKYKPFLAVLVTFGLLIGFQNCSKGFDSNFGNSSLGNSDALELNVKNFGAKGDGVTDDGNAINAAIAAAESSVAKGETRLAKIYLPCGNYVISAGLRTIRQSHIWIMGDSNCASKLSLIGSLDDVQVIRVAGGGLGTSVNLADDVDKNSFTLVKDGVAAAEIKEGDLVLFSDQRVASNGPTGPLVSSQEIARIATLNGDSGTIERLNGSTSFARRFKLVSPYPQNQGGNPIIQKILSPLVDVKLLFLTIDGSQYSGTGGKGLVFVSTDGLEVRRVSLLNFKGPNSNGFIFDTGYQTVLKSLVCHYCGNNSGSAGDLQAGHSILTNRQSYMMVDEVEILNDSSQVTMGFDSGNLYLSQMSKVHVNAGRAVGRPFKILRSNWNQFSSVVVENGAGNHHGIAVADISTHNTFRNCAAINNTGTGIALFGNYNMYNTFDHCSASGNTVYQIGTGPDAFGHWEDHYTTLIGGSYVAPAGSQYSAIYPYTEIWTITK